MWSRRLSPRCWSAATSNSNPIMSGLSRATLALGVILLFTGVLVGTSAQEYRVGVVPVDGEPAAG